MTIKRLFDFPYHQLEVYNLQKAFVTKYDGKWTSVSSKEYIDQSNCLSRGLLKLNIQPNDKIAVISSTNRTEWNIVDIGIMQVGAQSVPVYPNISEEEYEYVLNHSEATICFVSDKEILDKVQKIEANVPSLKEIYTFDEIEDQKNWKEVLELGKSEDNQSLLDDRKQQIQEDDVATLIYTSGTTGKPKGVKLSHKNLVSNAICSEERFPINKGEDRALSFLPLCHVYERMLIYLYQYTGVSVYYAESIDHISENLKEVKPHVMTAVPRLLEKIYDKIIAKGTNLTGVKRKLFYWSLELGNDYEPYGTNGWWYEQKLALARKLVFSKWREALGGELKVIASGSAALQPRLARIYNAAGIKVMEGYGLTESSPVIAVNDMRNRGFKIGTVGKPIPQTEIKIAEDGEIMVKGPQVMLGYYKDEEKTNEVIEDGYLHTGDIGTVDSDGFLKITDRKKEMFKTSGGKYIAPQLIENIIKQSRFIEQIMVVGEGEKMPTALIQPNFEFIQEWAKKKNIKLNDSYEDLVENDEVKARIQQEIDQYNERFGKWERVKRFELTPEVWSIDDGHLTPTMKLKRRVVKERYMDLYNKLYEHVE